MFHQESHFTDPALSVGCAAGRKALPFVILLLIISLPVQGPDIGHQSYSVLSHGRNVVNLGWPDTIRPGLMLRLDASLAEDLLRESPASRKLKFLNGSSRRVTGGHVRSRSMNTRLSSFTDFVRLYVRPATGDPADHPSIPATHWNPFSRGIVRDLYP